MRQKSVIESSFITFLAETAFGGVLFENIEGEAAPNSPVLGTIARPYAGGIRTQGPIQHPMKTVFNPPMAADGIQAPPGIRL